MNGNLTRFAPSITLTLLLAGCGAAPGVDSVGLPTPTASPTSTPPPASSQGSPTPESSPAGIWVAPGDVFFEENFSDPGTGWLDETTPDHLIGYVDDAYLIEVRSPGVSFSEAPIGWDPIPQMGIEVDVTQAATSGGMEFYAVACMTSATESYVLAIAPAQRSAFIARSEHGRLQDLRVRRRIHGIRRMHGVGDANHVSVSCASGDRTRVTLRVNGRKVSEVLDGRSTDGFVGVRFDVGTQSGDTAFVADDLTVRLEGPS